MTFNPDQYLKDKQSEGQAANTFDPEKYLASKGYVTDTGSPVYPEPPQRQPAPDQQGLPSAVFHGAVDPILHYGSAAILEPFADLFGLTDIPLHALGITKTEPADVQSYIRSGAYTPETRGGVAATQAIGYPFKLYGEATHWAGKKLGSEGEYPSFGRLTEASLNALPALIGAKYTKVGDFKPVLEKAKGVVRGAVKGAKEIPQRAYRPFSTKYAKSVAEASRERTQQYVESRITREAAKHGQIEGHYKSEPYAARPVANRDVPSELRNSINKRVDQFNAAYKSYRDDLKSRWQNVAKQKEAKGEYFQDSQGAKRFIDEVDYMINLHRGDEAIVSKLESFKKMVVGTKEHRPTFEALETVQQKIKAAGGDPTTRTIPNLVNQFNTLSRSLDNAMGDYAPEYRTLIKKWGDIMDRKNALDDTARFAEKYSEQLRKISPRYAQDPRTTFKSASDIVRGMEDDGLISVSQAGDLMRSLNEAEKTTTDIAAARAKAGRIALWALVLSMGAKGWWAYHIHSAGWHE